MVIKQVSIFNMHIIFLSESRIYADDTDFADFGEIDCQRSASCARGIREQSRLQTAPTREGERLMSKILHTP